jgi:hypothetical protein
MMIAQHKVDRVIAREPELDGLTAYRVACSRELVQRRAADVRRAAIAAGRGIYK